MPYDSEITTKSRDLIVLEKARERIARGWCQELTDVQGNVCIVGALKEETGSLWGWMPRQHIDVARALRHMKFRIPHPCDTRRATEWNDAEDRTQAEVLARFDEAIARLQSQT